MERREFLVRAAKAAGLTAVTVGASAFFYKRVVEEPTPAVFKEISFETPASKELPQVTLATNQDSRRALNAALDGIGGIKRFIKPGERVTIKPNVGWDRTPEQAANTNPELVGEMVRLCIAAGAARVIVTDVTCNDPRRCFLRSGIRDAVEDAGGTIVLPESNDFIDVNLEGKLLTEWPVLKHFIDTDRLINMPVVKHHSLTRGTIAMKNLYGIIGGRRGQLHQQIDQSIVDLAAFALPTLTVIDATRVLQQGGPQGGSLEHVTIHDSVMCATDQVAGDSRASEFLGVTGEDISHIVLAERSGLGRVDYRNAGYKEVSV